MRYRWLPWKFILRHVTQTSGFLDPVALMAQLSRFAQPSEVAAPVELLRAGMVFHARGLMNARVIQGNLDWLWPFWICKQFDPLDNAFVPRSFAITQVNLTNRNWTAVGLPDCPAYPIVDPRGLVTPHFDGWSLDAWIVTGDNATLLPPLETPLHQRQLSDPDRLAVETEFQSRQMQLRSLVDVWMDDGRPTCRIRYTARSEHAGALVIALRPFNPEGISFIYRVAVDPDHRRWTINDEADVIFDRPMDRHMASEYREGDVFANLLHRKRSSQKSCEIGMASAAAVYLLPPNTKVEVSVNIPLDTDTKAMELPTIAKPMLSWEKALSGVSRLKIPDRRMQQIYDAAVRTLILLSPLEIYPGPFYYRRFWFRDAVFILHGMLSLGLHERAERAIDHFLARQTVLGYFESQQGEWDSNGQVLWIIERFSEVTGKAIPDSWLKAVIKGARWILRKRLPVDSKAFEAGLLPAGFSAEHLGNNDFYYWDDFWGIAGLHAAARLCERVGKHQRAALFAEGADHFFLCVERSLLRSRRIRVRDAIPASPYRRMDAGAIGSIIAGYPLQLWPPNEPRLMNTLEYLLDRCFIDGAFFQDMIHSGFNIYLTLHCAQCLLQADDPRYWPMVEKVAQLATSTGHWPEAVHPKTLGGCMGDGQHTWAATEWVLMINNMFAAEEGDRLILLRGIPRTWLKDSQGLAIGPLHTRFGTLEIAVEPGDEGAVVQWTARWRSPPAELVVRLPGTDPTRWDAPADTSGRLNLKYL